MRFETGTRVRCVDAGYTRLHDGEEYTVEVHRFGGLVTLQGVHGEYLQDRFRPVVRVKAPSRPMTFEEHAAFITDRFNALPECIKAEHWRRQRASWVRSELELSRLERGETRVLP